MFPNLLVLCAQSHLLSLYHLGVTALVAWHWNINKKQTDQSTQGWLNSCILNFVYKQKSRIVYL